MKQNDINILEKKHIQNINLNLYIFSLWLSPIYWNQKGFVVVLCFKLASKCLLKEFPIIMFIYNIVAKAFVLEAFTSETRLLDNET